MKRFLPYLIGGRIATQIAAAALFLLTITTAHARVEMPARGTIAMAFGNATEYADGWKWNANTLGTAAAEAAVLKQIEEGYSVGVRAFWYDAASTNSAAHVYRMARWNAAARTFNAAHPADKVCIMPGFESGDAGNGTTDGALPLFDQADAGGANSPLCTVGGKPAFATWGGSGWSPVCVNPVPAISARGPFHAFSVYNVSPWYPPSDCVSALKAGGGTVSAVLWSSGNSGNSNQSNVTNIKNAAIAAGANDFVLGIGNARAEGCGIGGNGTKNSNIVLTDMNYWQHFLEGFRIARALNLSRTVYTMGFPGDLGESSYITASRMCDANDVTAHNIESGGINHGFSCPNVPDYIRAAIPTGFQKSLSLPMWTRPGFLEAARVLGEWQVAGAEPSVAEPFVAFAYRQHKFQLGGTFQICPDATSTASASGIGGGFNGDKIALTSWLAVPTRVRVRLAGDTIFDGTLPARQMGLTSTATQQTTFDFGNRVGRPIIEVLNAAGDVVASKEGLLEITTTPRHLNGQTGRNPGLYADYVAIAAGGGGFSGIMLATTGAVTSNVVSGVSGTGILTTGAADNVDIAGNTVSGAAAGIIVGSDAGSGFGRSMAAANNIVANITGTGIGVSGDVGADVVYPNNLFYSNGADMAAGVSAVAANTITANPLFVSSTDFHLQSGSPARGAGLAAYPTGTDRDGRARKSPPDIGALEYHDPAARSACVAPGADTVDPCAPGGVDYPCSSTTPDTCPAAPTLTSPTNIVVPSTGGSYTLAADQDAMVTCGDYVVSKTIAITGGRKVHVKGCEIVLTWDGVTAAQNREALKMVGMREAYIEGVLADANDRCEAITVALAPGSTPLDVTIVNTWTGNSNHKRLDGSCDGDCIDVQSVGVPGIINLATHKVTCVAKSEGIFASDRQPGGDNSVTLNKTNVRYGQPGVPRFDLWNGGLCGYYFSGWEASPDNMNPNIKVNLTDVYIDWIKSDRNICPGPATGDPGEVDFGDPNSIRFTRPSFSGTISKGVPVTGDFAPRELVGRNYDRAAFCE